MIISAFGLLQHHNVGFEWPNSACIRLKPPATRCSKFCVYLFLPLIYRHVNMVSLPRIHFLEKYGWVLTPRLHVTWRLELQFRALGLRFTVNRRFSNSVKLTVRIRDPVREQFYQFQRSFLFNFFLSFVVFSSEVLLPFIRHSILRWLRKIVSRA